MKKARMAGCFLGLIVCVGARATAQDYQNPFYYCTLLDQETETIWDVETAYVFEGSNDAPGWDDIGFIGLKASAGLLYFETQSGGDIDLRFSTDTRILQGFDGTSSGYPLSIINLDLRWDQRFVYGWGMQFELKPGLYSALVDFGGSNWAIPLGIAGVRALNEGLSVLLGLSVYPGFDRVVDPKIGLRWTPSADVELDVFYPETRLAFQLTPGLSVHAGARFLSWLEYQMEEDDPRDRLQLDENRLILGVDLHNGDYGKWTVDLGYYFDRKIDFEKVEAGVDIDDSFGISIGYKSLF